MKRRQFLKLLPVLPAAYVAQAELQEEADAMVAIEYDQGQIDRLTAREAFSILFHKVAKIEGATYVRKRKDLHRVRVSPIVAPRLK